MAKVYSTDAGRLCSGCEKPVNQCQCRQNKTAPKGDGIIRISRETKGRKGAGVTLINGLDLTEDSLKKLAKQLKARCSSGGTIKNGTIEIQGDHRSTIKEMLENHGFSVKLAGG